MEKVRIIKQRKTLTDGTVKEYKYEVKYINKHDQKHKQDIYDMLRKCNDPEKIDIIYKQVMEILNNNQVKQDKVENNNHDAA